MSKVFGLGLSHTGTMSLNVALNVLGIRSVHYPLDRQTYREISRGRISLTLLQKYDAITDITTIPFYKQYDRNFPGSKFILTVRDKDVWIKSMRRRNEEWLKYVGRNFFSKYFFRFKEDYKFYKLGAFRSTLYRIQHEYFIEHIRTAVYGGIALEDDSKLADVYDAHHRDVKEYFKDRPQDLLYIDITEGEGWEKLCPFLNKPIPSEQFPYRTNTRFKPLKSESKI